jgi:hypothetical protein
VNGFLSTLHGHVLIHEMASKLSAATVIEGNISDEGLAAMSDCQDLTTQLARELAMGIKDEFDDLGESFKKMAILKPKSIEPVPSLQTQEKTIVETPAISPVPIPILETAIITNVKSVRKKSQILDTDQLSLFDLLAG